MNKFMATTTKLMESLRKFLEITESFGARITSWENYVKILDSEELRQSYNKKWSSLRTARSLVFILARDANRFEEEKPRVIANIKANNPRLAEKIEVFKPVPEDIRMQLAQLLDIVNKDRAFAVSYIKTHSRELVVWIESLQDVKDKDKLRQLITEISGAEVDELNKCTADLEKWKDFRIGNGMPFFYTRVVVYLRGGILGKLENERFLGLVSHFRDKSMLPAIKNSYALKMLLTYQRMLQFFKISRNTVAYAALNRGWEGFRGPNGWFNNLEKGKNYIAQVRDTFGNKDIANMMEQMYETTGEYPEGWLKNIDKILARIKHPVYQNAYVIVPAADDLLRILNKRKDELLAKEVGSSLEELRAILRKDFEAAFRNSRNLQAFQRIVNDELVVLQKEIKVEKNAFADLLVEHAELVISFAEEHERLSAAAQSLLDRKIVAYYGIKKSQLMILNRARSSPRLNVSNDPRSAVAAQPFLLEVESELMEREQWSDMIKKSRLRDAKYEAQAIEEAIKKAEELSVHVSAVDAQLRLVKDRYFELRRNGKEISILDPEYLIAKEENIS